MAFEENKHPRAKDGKFTSKGGGTSTGSTKTSTPKQKVEYDEDYERSWGSASTKGDPKKLLKSIGKLIESGDDAEANELVEKLENSLPFKDEKEHKEWLDVLFSYSDFRDFENATNKIINNANSGIEKIDIDDDYERSWGEAPDPEEFPEDYKKYVESYKKWLKNGETSTSKEDEEKERKQAYKLFNLPF